MHVSSDSKPALPLTSLAGLLVTLLGLSVLLGWMLDVTILKRVAPAFVGMNPITALALALSGVSLHLLVKKSWLWLGRGCAVAVVLVGLMKLHVPLDLPFEIDLLLFTDELRNGPTSRMAPNAALNFVLFGVALLLMDVRTRHGYRPARWFAMATVSIGLMALVGYVYGFGGVYAFGPYQSMALHSAFAFVVLGLGILGRHPQLGLLGLLTGEHAGSVMARRLLLAVIAIPLLIGWIRLMGEQAGLLDVKMGLPFTVVSNMAMLIALVWWSAQSLNQAERRLATQHAVTRVLAESADLSEAMPKLLEILASRLGWDLGAIWMGEDADNLQCAEIWPKPEGEHAPFGRTTLTTLFTAGRGLRGRVWARSQAVWISDLKQSKDPRMPLGAEEGFRTAVTFPILIEDRALGVVELFSREVKPPDERLLAALGAMGISIGQFVARKRAEAKVQEAVKIKSEFISIVSHELRTPMTAIKEGIDLVLDGSAGPLNVDQQDFLETAKRNVDRLARLINDVLDFQRLEAGRMVFQMQPVGLETVIQETIESFQLVAEKKGLALVSRLGSLPLFRVTGTRLHKS